MSKKTNQMSKKTNQTSEQGNPMLKEKSLALKKDEFIDLLLARISSENVLKSVDVTVADALSREIEEIVDHELRALMKANKTKIRAALKSHLDEVISQRARSLVDKAFSELDVYVEP